MGVKSRISYLKHGGLEVSSACDNQYTGCNASYGWENWQAILSTDRGENGGGKDCTEVRGISGEDTETEGGSKIWGYSAVCREASQYRGVKHLNSLSETQPTGEIMDQKTPGENWKRVPTAYTVHIVYR